jgi:hypothetical protein
MTGPGDAGGKGRDEGWFSYQPHGLRIVPPRHWYDRLPDPVIKIALRSWGYLPSLVRQRLARLTPLVNRQAISVSGEVGPGPDEVAGVTEARLAGFTPIEELTGRTELATVWPAGHRRSVAETRALWVDEQPRLWLVRSPWPSISVDDAVAVVWLHLEGRPGGRAMPQPPDDLRLARDVLRWPEARARATLAGR